MLAPNGGALTQKVNRLPRSRTGDRLNDEGDSNGAQADVQRRAELRTLTTGSWQSV
jgi:hypothetical protein